MNTEELYISAFLAVLPVCLTHYYRFASDANGYRQNNTLDPVAVDEAHHVPLSYREMIRGKRKDPPPGRPLK
jgi:hypothetical protein